MVIRTAVDTMIKITGNKGRTLSHSALSVVVHVNTTLFSDCTADDRPKQLNILKSACLQRVY